ncbi:hypothetical protein [Streptomyces sp. bgisy031]|uniref:hypothetical protein n=1 Tax=Streptomyces sp. bgisy031 TaxID=3413772 RepID=UPI003D714AF7
MIENVPWEDLSGDPDKYIAALKERERDMQREAFQLRQEVRLMCQLKKYKDTTEDWRQNGIPEQRQTEPDEASTHGAGAGSQGATRKERICALLAQDPQRQWKVKETAIALGEGEKEKSVRVAMDELARANKITKQVGPTGTLYQYGSMAGH